MTRLLLALALLLTSPSGTPGAPPATSGRASEFPAQAPSGTPQDSHAVSRVAGIAPPGGVPQSAGAFSTDVGRTSDADSDGSAPALDVRQGREGFWTHMGAGYPADYLAIPLGPGVRVVACGPARCLTLTSTDAGPARSALLRGIIGDLSVALFRRLCGCSETRGTFRGSWRLAVPEARPRVTLPPTSTLP